MPQINGALLASRLTHPSAMELHAVLLNATKLLSYIGRDEAPVVIMCPECESVFHLATLWNTIQHRSTEVVCVCGSVLLIPKLSDAVPRDREVPVARSVA